MPRTKKVTTDETKTRQPRAARGLAKTREAKRKHAAATKPEAAKREPIVKVKEPKVGAPCWCGCGETAGYKRSFRPGHDQRLKGIFIKVEGGKLPVTSIKPVTIENRAKIAFVASDERYGKALAMAMKEGK